MNREELIRQVWEEQHRQHGLIRRKRRGDGERPPAHQEHLLHILKRHPLINQKDLAEKVHVRPQSLGEMLGKMEEGGLILRKKDPADGRATHVEMTPAGEALEREHHEKVFREIKARYSALTDDELTEYLRLTRIINETLEQE
ncbi:MAG: MarR family transcriptional regulator [Clostridia bacterium]|nr:MarR family transcriptional regulator [Clostridia bacterium]